MFVEPHSFAVGYAVDVEDWQLILLVAWLALAWW